MLDMVFSNVSVLINYFIVFLSCTGSTRGSRALQADSGGHDGWESRSSGLRERSSERNTERATERDRYDSDRQRGEQVRDSSYDRRGSQADRDRRDHRERGYKIFLSIKTFKLKIILQ